MAGYIEKGSYYYDMTQSSAYGWSTYREVGSGRCNPHTHPYGLLANIVRCGEKLVIFIDGTGGCTLYSTFYSEITYDELAAFVKDQPFLEELFIPWLDNSRVGGKYRYMGATSGGAAG